MLLFLTISYETFIFVENIAQKIIELKETRLNNKKVQFLYAAKGTYNISTILQFPQSRTTFPLLKRLESAPLTRVRTNQRIRKNLNVEKFM